MPEPTWPTVAICIVTYDRLREIKTTINALREHIQYKGELRWHIADDQSPQGYLGQIFQYFNDMKFTHTTTQRQGWGANVNKAMSFLNSSNGAPYIFICEDDYVAQRDLNFNQGIALLETEKEIGAVRYDGIAAHDLVLHLKECESKLIPRFSYCIVARDSPHLNVYSNRPHLKHRRFHGCYGWYPEGVSLGDTETQFAHRVKDMNACPKIAILADGIPTAFDHIGKSRQGSEADKESSKR